uniref:Uncharacterized protein n=1 Tax=Opuntia streptacantha TaxID=393608 RepID=A0A7C9DSP2_OPUST
MLNSGTNERNFCYLVSIHPYSGHRNQLIISFQKHGIESSEVQSIKIRTPAEKDIFNNITLSLRFFHRLKTFMHHFKSNTKLAIDLCRGLNITVILIGGLIVHRFDQGPS